MGNEGLRKTLAEVCESQAVVLNPPPPDPPAIVHKNQIPSTDQVTPRDRHAILHPGSVWKGPLNSNFRGAYPDAWPGDSAMVRQA